MSRFDELESVIAEKIQSMGYDFVDFRYVGMSEGKTILIKADAPGGITLGDCGRISREIGDLLEDGEWGLGKYRLEVSSPGLDRPLKKREDFERFCGQKVSIKTNQAHDGRRNYRGKIMRIEEDTIYLEIDGSQYGIAFDDVRKANLVYEDKTEGKGKKKS